MSTRIGEWTVKVVVTLFAALIFLWLASRLFRSPSIPRFEVVPAGDTVVRIDHLTGDTWGLAGGEWRAIAVGKPLHPQH